MTDDDNFFARWSRLKAQVRTGQPLPPEPVPLATAPVKQPAPAPVAAPAAVAPPSAEPTQPPPALPTLDDVARLTGDADFSPFVGHQVPAAVRNAAMKKLFADPRYNVMDGLDIYIDDYTQPSPLSAAAMAKMVGAQFLKVVEDPADTATQTATQAPTEALADPATPADPDTPTSAATAPAQPKAQDDHADLQLQPDHAPEPQSPGRGAG